MRQNTILNTQFSTAVSFKRQAEEAVKYLIMNQQNVLVKPIDLKNIWKKSENSIKTPLTDTFIHLSDFYKNKKTPFVNIFLKQPNIPEILSLSSVMFDCREVLKNKIPEFDDVIVNLTNYLTTSKHSDELLVSDITSIQNIYVKALLCSSYNSSKDRLWLPAKLSVFVIKTFDTILTTLIRNVYNITDFQIIKRLSFINSLFMTQQLIPERDIETKPVFIYRLPLGNTIEIDSMFSYFEDLGVTFNKRLTPSDLADIIKKTCGERFSTFDSMKLSRIFSSGSLDKTFSNLSLEYPPYWVYQLLDIASGGKHVVYSNIFRNTKMKPEISAFAYELNRNMEIFASLEK